MSRTYYIPNMLPIGLTKSITQPVAGLSLLAIIAIAFPSPVQAQQPNTLPLSQPSTTPTLQPSTDTGVPAPNTGSAAPAPGVSTQPLPAPIDYTLGGGDRIRINVFEVPEYTGDYQIPPGGDLYLPLIGAVSVLGLTQSEAAEAIAAKYSRYLKRPLVTVSLVSPRPINVIISGEVNRPGSYTVGLQGGAGDNPGVQYPTIIGALTLAEGVTLAADLGQIQLRRANGVGGPEQLLTLDLKELARTGNVPRDITLRDGDKVFVPTATSVNKAEIRQFATASFAAPPGRPRSVTVVGEVNRPGSYVVIGGSTAAAAPSSLQGAGTIEASGGSGGGLPTISRAVQLAGGITSSADVRNIQIRRLTKTGVGQNISANFWDLLQGDTTQDTIVQDGDTIVIPKATDLTPAQATALADASFSPATIQVSVVGEVKNPGLVNVPPNTPLNQAILNAGGFNNSRARRSSVELVRLNPDGTVTKRKLPVDLAANINNQNNPSLSDNDIVVVGRSGTAKVGDTLGSFFGPILSPVLGILGVFR